MWRYNDVGQFRAAVHPSSAVAQSTHDLLLGLRGVAAALLFLDLSDPNKPVAELSGVVENVTTTHVTIGLAGVLPNVSPRTRFGVEVMAGSGVLRFQAIPHSPPEPGANRIQLQLPRQIESVQRRKFSRVVVTTAVAFSIDDEATVDWEHDGIGQSVDCSAGGIRFTTNTRLQYGQELTLSFNTPDGTVYRDVHGRVTRVHAERGRYTIGLQFIHLDDKLAEQIAQTIFRLQVKGLAKC